jgi:ATP-dependent exoDNAse (exonuclease V) beta subunit
MKDNLTIVPAGAGAGKTHRIKAQLTEWVKDGTVRPERILAVTFTEAAAAELTGRIRQSLMEEGLIDAALAVERAYVSTIHSLGLRILTEHAFAAGSAPQPRHLHEAEQDLLIRQAISQCRALDQIAANPERFGHGASWSKGSEEGLRDRVLGMIALLRGLGPAGLSPQLAPDACARIDRIWGHVMADPAPAEARLLQAVAALLGSFPKGVPLEGLNPSARKDFRRDLARLRLAVEPGRLGWDWKLWNDLRKLRGSKRGAPTPAGYDTLAAEVMLSAEAVVSHPGPREDAKTNLTALIAGAQDIMTGYAERKRALGVIDYTDMIVQAEALLRDRPDVLEAVLGEIDCVIIDEFQDTNPVQFALLWQLADRAPRTLLVGDVKQSIMGFQGADPRLSEALAEIWRQNVDPLSRNWRSDPRIMAAINAIGPGLFGSGYLPLAPTRQETGPTALEVLRLSGSRTGRTKPKPPSHVAARIAAMVTAGEIVTDRDTGAARPVRPGDIAVLTRSHAEAARYADALREQGLPVRIAAAGWYDAEVVIVARYALALAADPLDSHAALVVLTLGPAELPLDRALNALADGALLGHAAVQPLLAFAPDAARLPVTLTLARVCATLRPWAETLPDAVQALADLARLEALAEEFDAADTDMLAAAGFYGRGPLVFLGWLAARIEERDFDRHPDPGIGAAAGVEIVTWHGAKGREWPVTLVCELDSKVVERENTTRAVFTDFSDLTRVLDKALLVHTPRYFVPETLAAFVADRQAAAEAEARNLIYVALTRARDRLIIEWVEPALEKEDVSHLSLLVGGAGLTLGAGLVVGGQSFAADIHIDPALMAGPALAIVSPPFLRFGAEGPRPIPAGETPWRRRPSTLAEASGLPGPLQLVTLGTAHISARDMTATDRGTAWHRAFRVLADRPDLAPHLPAATGLSAGAIATIADRVRALKDWLNAEGFPDLRLEVPLHVTHPDGSETLGIVDALAFGPTGLLILDHKTGPVVDAGLRFQAYWPQLSAYVAALHLAFPASPVRGAAIHWIEAGTLSLLSLASIPALSPQA